MTYQVVENTTTLEREHSTLERNVDDGNSWKMVSSKKSSDGGLNEF